MSHSEATVDRDASAAANIDLDYQLQDNLTRRSGRVFLSGTQALVRLLFSQQAFDQSRGINTAGYVTGYRGSPLAGVDFELWRSKNRLEEHAIKFVPGVNEDLAATAMMGTQRVEGEQDRKFVGVFGMWYGKGPGVDRAGDALRHGNAAGSSPHGGVLLIVGDDHAATSSSIPNASDYSLLGWGIPIVNPSSVEEYEYFGLWGWELSRRSGTWVAFKAISETVESARSVTIQPWPVFANETLDAAGARDVHYRTSDFLTQAIENRLEQRHKLVSAFARLNSIDKLVVPAPEAELGIITVGKAHHDVMEVLAHAETIIGAEAVSRIRIYKPGLTFPLDRQRLLSFARGLRHILVVEEKVGIVEQQVKEMLFNADASNRPAVTGRRDERGEPLIPWTGQLRPSLIAHAIFAWLESRLGRPVAAPCGMFAKAPVESNAADGLKRLPYFCSGCPHNSSTKVPEGSRATAGVGCHYMASWMDRSTSGLIQMGGEGVDWLGTAPFTNESHIFQNMGEGTYFHSGHLAIRQAIAANVNITYKILFNDAVAMTGGQPVDGKITVPQIAQQMSAEGARRVVVVTDYPENYRGVTLPANVPVRHRRELDSVQRELREVAGTTILIYDQTCAAEKRRRRKRGTYPDPSRRLMINAEVCEGCGDCGVQSNCMSIVPRETEFGRKRQIDQSSCNKDYSCAEGFCPSFVSVTGGELRKGRATIALDHAVLQDLPTPALPALDRPWHILVAGVGGTGVITVGALISMAAHLEGKAVSLLDFTALAQKGGSVLSHVRIAQRGHVLHPVRIEWQQSDLLIACDGVVGMAPDALGTVGSSRTLIVLNSHAAPLAEFTRDAEAIVPMEEIAAKFRSVVGESGVEMIDAHAAATVLLGDSIGSNVFLLGYCWQRGKIPVSLDALMRAIELNGVSVQQNKLAFAAGRLSAVDSRSLERLSETQPKVIEFHRPEQMEAVIARCERQLSEYQSSRYARTYTHLVGRVLERERALLPGKRSTPLTLAVATNLHRLMSYKDEYEVARLLTSKSFARELRNTFGGDFKVKFHLAPPMFAKKDKTTGVPRKAEFGPWLKPLLHVLAKGRALRGSPLDVFGMTSERRRERQLIGQYSKLAEFALSTLNENNHAALVRLLQAASSVRGYGHVKLRNIEAYERALETQMAQLHGEAVEVGRAA
ncbi:indolepyruvate ferredoxin oxidoreductase family protein [Paraburkholderia agricolaris]|uniref:indolepyruvate ferredoxin oxidoreductase family protein n=1 Tax=Paraburkholderia agricolaris TaxID=2152888 RepID=UPI001290F251|nr:indolepyruvate ferredoxin oxidoreductase family protein [Paraburkholderia agricolaris]